MAAPVLDTRLLYSRDELYAKQLHAGWSRLDPKTIASLLALDYRGSPFKRLAQMSTKLKLSPESQAAVCSFLQGKDPNPDAASFYSI